MATAPDKQRPRTDMQKNTTSATNNGATEERKPRASRAREQTAKRSLAAKKGWATRRTKKTPAR